MTIRWKIASAGGMVLALLAGCGREADMSVSKESQDQTGEKASKEPVEVVFYAQNGMPPAD